MPAMLMAMMLAAGGQDTSTLKMPPPRGDSEPRSRFTGAEPRASCPRPAGGEVVLYEQLPTEVLADLRRTDPAMSPPGGPFNATDVEGGGRPHTRIVAALRQGDRLAVAYEKGGWGYSATVLTYELQSVTGRYAIKGVHPIDPGNLKRAPGAPEPACAALERALAL